MDMKISGSGTIPGGEYDAIRISGSGKCVGKIRCVTFHCSGSSHCSDDIDCSESFSASGRTHLEHHLTAEEIGVSGSCHINGDCKAGKRLSVSGSCKIDGSLSSPGELRISGSFKVGGGIEAESAVCSGRISCSGLLNAETVQIRGSSFPCSQIGSIGGSRIEVKREAGNGFLYRFSRKRGVGGKTILTVADGIEGDDISLEYTTARCVTGRTVVIGDGCEIETLRYSERADISPNATVKNTEKIG